MERLLAKTHAVKLAPGRHLCTLGLWTTYYRTQSEGMGAKYIRRVYSIDTTLLWLEEKNHVDRN